MRRPSPPLVLLLAVCALPLVAPAARALPPGYALQLIQGQRDFPTTIRFAPDGRLFYTELFSGRIMVYPNGIPADGVPPNPVVWATVPVAPGGEHGVLGMTFHPDWPESAYIYVFHTRPSPVYNRIARLRDQGGVGVGYTVLLDSLFANAIGRFGGRLAFGPDKLLYVSIGDCTLPGAAQDTSNVIGKILRLGFTGKPAPNNPFGPKNPIFALGVRNPYGLCFDSQSGYGYFSDNGPLCDDEMNRLMSGVNYGWGPADTCGGQPAGTYLPMTTFTPTIGLTGCTMYRGTSYPASYSGNIFVGGYTDGSVRRLVCRSFPGFSVVDTVEVWATVPTPDTHVLDVTQGPDGRIWFSTFDQIWRVLQPPASPVAVEEAVGREWLTVAPNPSNGAVTFSLAGARAFDDLDVIDVAGRQVRHWSGPLPAALVWDGRAADGRLAPPGVYWVRGMRGGQRLQRRISRLGH